MNKSVFRSLRGARRRLRAALKNVGAGEDDRWLADNRRRLFAALRDAEKLLRAGPEANAEPLFAACRACADGKSDAAVPERLLEVLAVSEADILLCEALPVLLAGAAAVNAAAAFGGNDGVFPALVRWLISLSGVDFEALLPAVCEAEALLCKDPAGAYPHMDASTRAVYRRRLAQIAKKEKISQTEAAHELLRKSRAGNRHIGFFLAAPSRRIAPYAFVMAEALLPAACEAVAVLALRRAGLTGSAADTALFAALCYLPLFACLRPLTDRLAAMLFPPRFLPSMDPEGPAERFPPTLITVSMLLPRAEEAEALYDRLLALYDSTRLPGVRVCALFDHPAAKTPVLPTDAADAAAARRVIDRLNRTCGGGFMLLLRDRVYAETENEYTGFERKRGAIEALIREITGGDGNFSLRHGDGNVRGFRYILALDADTGLPFEELRRLLAAAVHPMNAAVIENGRIVSGYGCFSPRTETAVASAAASVVPMITTAGGIGAYRPRVSERNMDLFGTGLFCGKGLIDVRAYAAVCMDAFSDGVILSHDIMEGEALRTAFVGNCVLTEDFPSSPAAYLRRQERWIRGDVQNLRFLFRPFRHSSGGNRARPLTALRLLDNVRRAVTPVNAAACLLLGALLPVPEAPGLFWTGFAAAVAPGLFAAASLLFREGLPSFFRLSGLRAIPAGLRTLLRAMLSATFLPQEAAVAGTAVLRALYRSLVSRKRTLEWTPAAQSEHAGGMSPYTVYFPAAFALPLALGPLPAKILAAAVLAAIPFAASNGIRRRPRRTPAPEGAAYETLREYAAATWRYFEIFAGEEDRFLPSDNVQFTPVRRVAHRTSPTNIGLYLLCALAAADLSLITPAALLERLTAALESVRALPVYRGLLYNWYDTRTLQPLKPLFISAVDCGNYLVCLTVLRQGLREYAPLEPGFLPLIAELDRLLAKAELSFLYDPVRRLFSVGFDTERQAFSSACYDTYMSEARMTSYYAVAHRLVPVSHWTRLDRRLLRCGPRTAALSYSGTAFEYYFPTLFLPTFENSFAAEGLAACFAAQSRRRGGRAGLFGVSESGYYAFDEALNYRYRAHGLSALALRLDPHDEAVFAPYVSFLFLPFRPRESMKNLARFAACGAYGEYGFFEAIDATAHAGREDYMVVRSVMAHHAGMSLLAAANVLAGDPFIRRFRTDRAMRAALSLLEERFPMEAPALRVVRNPRGGASRRPRPEKPVAATRVGVFSDGEATLLCDAFGRNRMLFAGHTLLGYSPRSAGAFTAVRIEGALAPQLGAAACTLRRTGCARETAWEGCTVRSAAVLLKNGSAFALPVQVRNRAEEAKQISLYWYFEPKLLTQTDPDPHPAFSDLGLRAAFHAGMQALIFTRVQQGAPVLLAALHGREALFFCCDREEILGTDPARRYPFQLREPAFDCRTEERSPAAAVRTAFTLAPGESREAVLLLIPAATETEALARLAGLRRGGLPDIGNAVPEALAAERPAYRAAEALLAETFFGAHLPAAAERRAANRAPAEALWEQGVSGDLPLLCADADALPLPETACLIRTHARLLSCGVPCDLLLVTRRPADYEDAALRRLQTEIRRCGGRTSGAGGSCRAVNANACSPRFLSALQAAACAVLPEKSDAPPVLPPPELTAPHAGKPLFEGENGFVPGGYFIRDKKDTRPWCHTLANPSFGTLLSARSLGYTWAMNARQNKLTPWSNDVCSDLGGERLLMTRGGTTWDCVQGAAVYFYPERAVYGSDCGGVRVKVTVQADRRAMKKRVRVEYDAPAGARPVFSFRIRPVADEDGRRGAFLRAFCEEGLAVFRNEANTDYPGRAAVYAKSAGVCLAAVRAATHPAPCELSLTVEPEGAKGCFDLFMIFSASERGLAALRALPFAEPARARVSFHTGDRRLDLFASALLVHQAHTTRALARTGFYQCAGAYGYRDQLQDTANLCAIYPATARVQLLRCAAAQFPEGDVLHWFHAIPAPAPYKKGVRTRCSDDLLWLPWAAARYARVTGDLAVMRVQTPYLEGAPLAEGERERYGAYRCGTERDTLLGHCLRAFRRVWGDLGEHGLPRIRGGDWNDAFDGIGPGGQGESVWLAMFLRLVCREFIPVCEALGETAAARELADAAEAMQAAVLRHAWTGRQFLRAFFDDGAPLGHGEGPCATDLLTQAFAELSETGAPAARAAALRTACETLFDRAAGTVALFAPPFRSGDRRAGYVNDYPAGVRENGGQYTHAAVWFVRALFKAGMDAEAREALGALLPEKPDPDAARRYRNEPYALSGDARRGGPYDGAGGWSLYTGAAGVLAALLTERYGFTAAD